MDIFLSRLIKFYLNNTISLRILTQRIISCYTHKMAIVSWVCDVTSPYVLLHTTYPSRGRGAWMGGAVTGWPTFKVVRGTVALFDVDDVVVGLVALVARVAGRAESDEAVVAAQHEQRSVHDRHDESFSVAERVADRVQAAVHPRSHVATVRRPHADRTVVLPLDCKQARRRPVETRVVLAVERQIC